MTSLWPHESSAATPIGDCPYCGGTRYALLVHHCSTAVRFPQPLMPAAVPAKPKEGRVICDA